MKASLETTDNRLPAIVERLKAGGSLIKESRALGYSHNGPLRAALRELLGNENYNRMMSHPSPSPIPASWATEGNQA
jgi:hypothetical protein